MASAQETVLVYKDNVPYFIPVSSRGKRAFEARHGKGSMKRILQLLGEDCRRFSEVGEAFGLTGERARKIYKKHLAPHFPHKGGFERMRSCTLQRVHIKKFPEHVLAVWRGARRHGIAVTALNAISVHTVYTQKCQLALNGKVCKIHICRKKWAPGPYAHTHIGTTRKREYDFEIFVILVPRFEKRFYIVPLAIILHGHHGKGVSERKVGRSLYLPLTDTYTPRSGGIDWLTYKNAWHLLR